MCLAVLSLLVFSAASTSSVSKPFLCPLLTDPPPSEVPRLNFHRQKLDHATKITAFVGSSTSDLRLRHKTYHRVDFQAIYTMPMESNSSDHPRATTCRSKIRQLFHVPHAPSVLLRSTQCHRHRNNLSPIYITGEESASSNSPRTLTCRPKLQRGLTHVPYALHSPLCTC